MKIGKMVISSVAVLLVLLCAAAIPRCVSAEEAAIVTAGGRAFVGNGLPGVAMVASYDKRGRLTRLETKPVAKDCIARLDAKTGDKVMFWDGLGTMNMLSNAVTVTEDKTEGDGGNYDKAVYEKAVQSALYDALGAKKGEGMTELQKALALHDWLVMNCQYDTTVRRPYVHSEYGAIVNGFAVCAGYAKAYNDLLRRVGIKATYVTGMKPLKPGTNPQPHAWSRVAIDGVWYYVDVTADDPVPDQPGNVCRTFFLVSDDVLNVNDYDDFTTHCTDKRYEKYDLLTGFYMAFMWNEELQRFYYIDMDKVKMRVAVRTGTKLSAHGCDTVTFEISVNPGEPEKPLSKVASGGELSRIMLALKNVLTAGEDVGMLIFDEIDTGVSGHEAQQIGRKLSAIAKKKQTLCVTHLPQIAAMGDHHLRISKSVRDGRSYTDVSPTDRAHRVDEIARLLSGEEISDAARRNAEELLDAAGQGV